MILSSQCPHFRTLRDWKEEFHVILNQRSYLAGDYTLYFFPLTYAQETFKRPLFFTVLPLDSVESYLCVLEITAEALQR